MTEVLGVTGVLGTTGALGATGELDTTGALGVPGELDTTGALGTTGVLDTTGASAVTDTRDSGRSGWKDLFDEVDDVVPRSISGRPVPEWEGRRPLGVLGLYVSSCLRPFLRRDGPQRGESFSTHTPTPSAPDRGRAP